MPRRELLAALVLGGLLFWEACADWRKKEISVPATVLLVTGGLICLFSVREGLSVGLIFSLSPGLVLLVLAVLSEGKLGGGDALILLAMGLWLPFFLLSLTLLAALCLSAGYAVFLLLKGNRTSKSFPFLPFLLPAYLLCMLGYALSY